jgi:hypothetical protein
MNKESIILIPIKKKHLTDSLKHSCDKCGLAAALKEKFLTSGVFVQRGHSFVTINEITYNLSINEVAELWIKAFDAGILLQPTVFLLEMQEKNCCRLHHISDVLSGASIEASKLNVNLIAEYHELTAKIMAESENV